MSTTSDVKRLCIIKRANKAQITKLLKKADELCEAGPASLQEKNVMQQDLQILVDQLKKKIAFIIELDDKITQKVSDGELEAHLMDCDDYVFNIETEIRRYTSHLSDGFSDPEVGSVKGNTEKMNQPEPTPSIHGIDMEHDSFDHSISQAFVQPGSSHTVGMKHPILPRPDVPVFSGHPVDYCLFVHSFNTVIGSKVCDSVTKLNYLLQFTKGEANDCIRQCVLLGDKGFDKAMEILYDYFGRPNLVAESHIDTIVHGPPIRGDDIQGLVQLSKDMLKCEISLTQMGYLSEINNSINLRKIVKRLPSHLRGKWVERADEIAEQGHEPNFSDLAEFVKNKARASRSMYGIDLAHESKKSKPFVKPSAGSVKSGTTMVTEKEKPLNVGKKCKCCSKECKNFKVCEKFMSLSIDERVKLMKKSGLCFNCFGYNHMSKYCTRSSQCEVPDCRIKHHTMFHTQKSPENTEKSVEGSSNCVGSATCDRSKVCMNIIPVCIENENGPDIKTYAFIDSGSDICLCEKDLLQKLGISGVKRNYTITTLNDSKATHSGEEVSLTIKSLDNYRKIRIEKIWTVDKLPKLGNNLPTVNEIKQYEHLRDLPIDRIDSSKIELLIGSNVPEMICPIDVRHGKPGEPWGLLSPFGWSVIGPVCESKGWESKGWLNGNCHFQQVSDIDLHLQLEKMWKQEFDEKVSTPSMSLLDKKAFKIMEDTITIENGHYMIRMPWNDPDKNLPNNRVLAEKRLNYLKTKFMKNCEFKEKYIKTMQGYIDKGFAKKLVHCEPKSRTWYLPHHGVENPNKPGKVRVVFDCAAKYADTSLNDNLLQGPDLVNDLVGVLIRFRQERIALAADIEGMFNQVRVYPDDCDSLRFLWWEGGDLSKTVHEYCMNVHLFGAKSSPSCAAYALKRAGIDQCTEFNERVISTVDRNFYVDDLLKSVSSVAEANGLVDDIVLLLKNRGFRLTKWLSNSKQVLEKVPESEKAPSLVNIGKDDTLVDRALGVRWEVSNDVLCFQMNIKNSSNTRRGILSTISSLFDPLGLVAPVLLPGKLMLQNLCRLQLRWDEVLPPDEIVKWDKWVKNLPMLESVRVQRCFKSVEMGKIKLCELHVFCDASQFAYGACCYLRLVDTKNKVHCSLVMGKSRLAPVKQVTIPRLELMAAVVGCRLGSKVAHEIEYKVDRIVFWTDSMIVLGYIKNSSKRFKTFVANRLSVIHENSEPNQWNHVKSELNPADLASRGILPSEFDKLSVWLKGPKFLSEESIDFLSVGLNHHEKFDLTSDDVEIKNEHKVCAIDTKQFVQCLAERYSNYNKLLRCISWLNRFQVYCRKKYLKQNLRLNKSNLTVDEIEMAQKLVVQVTQRVYFNKEIQELEQNGMVSRTSPIVKLCPFLENDLIRVGGRLQKSGLSFNSKHPILLPQKGHVTDIIILNYHKVNGHVGVNHILTKLRETFWVINGFSAVKRVTSKCISCKKLRQKPLTQQMAQLPLERLTPDKPPFTYVGVDFFGPLSIKMGRSVHKRYGCLFTCLTIRAVHVEITHSLETDSFLCALRRFVARRGNCEKIFSDNGTNLVGGEKELRKAIEAWNQNKIEQELCQKQVEWHFNPPYASHMGGVYERMIRSVRSVLKSLIGEQLLDDESLVTLVTEAEKIINDRPITKVSSDVLDLEPLTPNMLLTLKSSNSLPPGLFRKSDLYARRRWRQVMYLSGIFWRRWISEYLPLLQVRNKWQTPQTSVKVGDLVLIQENSPRGEWPLGIVIETNTHSDGMVRSCKLKTRLSQIVRPITKLCPLEASEI